MLAVQYRPMTDTSWKRPAHQRRASQFTSEWNTTMKLLEKEIDALDGDDVTFELEVLPAAIRADGTGLRAHQAPASDAVVVTFETKKHGTQVHRVDTFTSPTWRRTAGWRHNIHAVAKTLEALRAVDRYGASGGQQYTGFAALPPGRAMPAPSMSHAEADEVLWSVSGLGRDHAWPADGRWRKARARAHPDRHGGDRTLWDQVEAAATVLGLSK